MSPAGLPADGPVVPTVSGGRGPERETAANGGAAAAAGQGAPFDASRLGAARCGERLPGSCPRAGMTEALIGETTDGTTGETIGETTGEMIGGTTGETTGGTIGETTGMSGHGLLYGGISRSGTCGAGLAPRLRETDCRSAGTDHRPDALPLLDHVEAALIVLALGVRTAATAMIGMWGHHIGARRRHISGTRSTRPPYPHGLVLADLRPVPHLFGGMTGLCLNLRHALTCRTHQLR